MVIADTRRPSRAKQRLEPVAAVGRVLSASSTIRATTSGGVVIGWLLAIGGRSLRPSRPCELEAALPVVEAGPVDPAAPAGLADVAQPLGQLQHRHPAMRQLLMRILGRDRFAPPVPSRHLLLLQPGPSQTARQGG